MNATVRRRPRWSNIGFALLTCGLVNLVAVEYAPSWSGAVANRLLALSVLTGSLLAFLYPLRDERLERHRVRAGVIIGLVFLVMAWTRILERL